MSKSILQRIPENLLDQIDSWALAHGEINRTTAINILIVNGLEADGKKILQQKIDALQTEIISLNKIHMPLIKALTKAAVMYENEEEGEIDQAFKKESRAVL